MKFECGVVDADVPLLLGLDVMLRDGMFIDIKAMLLKTSNWSVPMVYDYGHLVVKWMTSIHYNKKQLAKLHRQFRHLSAETIYAILKRVNPNKVDQGTLEILKESARYGTQG